MTLIIVAAGLFLLSCPEFGVEGSSLKTTSENGLYECKLIHSIPVLEVVPGGGWDNLRNIDMGRIMDISYHQCKTTEDGAYLIADEIFVIPQKHSGLDIHSEIIENWKYYKSTTASSINAEVSFFSFLNGKFSKNTQRVRIHEMNDKTFTARTQVRNFVYKVKSSVSFKLDSRFKQHLLAIGSHMENNRSSAARYESEMLIVNYGTHVLTQLNAGANLLQEDEVKQSFLSETTKSAVTTAIASSFFKTLKSQTSSTVTEEFMKKYATYRTHSRIESNGGTPYYPGMTLQMWQDSIENHLIAIDRSGLPLHVLINQHTLPDLPSPTVARISQAVEKAINMYYMVNTHPGCVDMNSPNFDYQANLDDHSCESPNTNFTFGGVYQECVAVFGANAQSMCPALEQKNPLTGGLSCPPQYTAVQLSSQFRDQGYYQNECHRKCHVFCKKKCHNVYHVRRVRFTTYWCAATGSVPYTSGLLFGGLYTTKSKNPLTNFPSCPLTFYALSLFDNMKVCVSNDFELGFRSSVPFGGFISCESGNPLADTAASNPSLQSSVPTNPSGYSKSCPRGFSQHVADIIQSCQVLYCVKSGAFTGGELLPIRLPPFSTQPLQAVGLPSTENYTMQWMDETQVPTQGQGAGYTRTAGSERHE
uniref:Macrophage-expressed gene 1 protein-like n=1 Tax=Callorhinchus milii TaxID=7868 RepID=A0A4W3K932_CALMI|eukprot:gi/632985561/ref/XP_007909750.1/ PREDICTED: macrophage-expressed gene 1 protein-like [Callorhinchus milii]